MTGSIESVSTRIAKRCLSEVSLAVKSSDLFSQAEQMFLASLR